MRYKYSYISSSLPNIHYVNPDAKVIIVGISPGNTQLKEMLKTKESLKERNRRCAFAGGMRDNLSSMLNAIRIHDYLGIKDCKTLWGEDFNLVNHTSILPYSVIKFNGNIPSVIENPNELEFFEQEYKKTHNNRIDGFYISNIKYKTIMNSNNTSLKECFDYFVEDLNNRYKKLGLIIALGPTYQVIVDAINDGIIHTDATIIHIPHASSAACGPKKGFDEASKGNPLPETAQTQVRNGYKLFNEAKNIIDAKLYNFNEITK